MGEFELCLKELGILGTHSYVDLDGKAMSSDSLPTLQTSQMNTVSATEQVNSNQQIVSGSACQLPSNMTNFMSEPSDLENVLSEDDVDDKSLERLLNNSMSCSVCNEDYSNRNELKAHMKSHTSSERPYVCPICQKSFRHLNVLRTHSRVHTGNTFLLHSCLFLFPLR